MVRLIRILIPLLLLGSSIYLSVTQKPDPMLTAGGIMGVGGLFWVLFDRQIQERLALRAIAKGSPTYQLDFSDGGYQITYTSPDGEQTSSDTMEYSTIRRACETKDHFVLLLGKQQGFALRRDGFTKGSAQEFAQFLSRQLGQELSVLEG